MASYRFCRPDDIPLLVAAVNRCYDVHFPGTPPLTVEELRREMKELQLWPSNSMVATDGEGPVAVMLGTKRAREVLVRRIGVAPGHQRSGHGRHLLGSLANKLAVLGPPRLVAEVPGALGEASAFFAASGWRREGSAVDYERPAASRQPPGELFAEVAVELLDEQGLLPGAGGLPWRRQAESLRSIAGLRGIALLGGERWEAWMVYAPRAAAGERGGGAEVYAYGWRGDAQPGREALLALLCDGLQTRHPGPLRLLDLLDGELPPASLAALGFSPAATLERFATEAVAA